MSKKRKVDALWWTMLGSTCVAMAVALFESYWGSMGVFVVGFGLSVVVLQWLSEDDDKLG